MCTQATAVINALQRQQAESYKWQVKQMLLLVAYLTLY